MPIYHCTSPGGLLDDSTRENVAKEITRIHCEATGALPSFVNVLFHETQQGRYFVDGQRSGHSIVFGAIRQGRTVETRHAMLTELSQMWTRVTGQPEAEVVVTFIEVPAVNMIEAGLFLPEPGDEQAWLDENSAHLAEVAKSGPPRKGHGT
jgi:phenylpyruvate tautomerase PptA (4-oxalocrotonate tautomerase family)